MHKSELILYALEAVIGIIALYKIGSIALRAWRTRRFPHK